jgi:BASS family bile acid:Na+ symporter
VSLSVIDTIQDIALHTLLPVMLGMGLNTLTPSLSARIEPWAVRVSGWFFFVVIAVLWYQNWQGIVGSFVASGVASLLMLLLAITCGYLLALLVGADERDRYTVMLEVGVQNGALAFFIALNIMGDVALLGPATVYSVAMVLFALPLLVYRRMKMRTV